MQKVLKLITLLYILTSSSFAIRSQSRIISHENDDETNISPYIIGGRNAKNGDAPWMVSIRNNLPQFLCGGAILTSRWVITSAQCTTRILLK